MVKRFISFDESVKAIEDVFNEEVGSEQVFLSESFGRVLSEDIIAGNNSPEYETSGMDGYAIKYEDQKLGVIKILGDLPAGSENKTEIRNGECIKTFTGSLISKGADTLIPIENVETEGDRIIIKEKVPKGFSVREIGENYKKSEILIKKGTFIEYAQIGVMAVYIVYAKMDEDYRKKSKKSEFTAVNLKYDKDGYRVNLKSKKSGTSAILTNMLDNAALLWIDENEGDLNKGDIAKVIRI